jgi:hypothetical protein
MELKYFAILQLAMVCNTLDINEQRVAYIQTQRRILPQKNP